MEAVARPPALLELDNVSVAFRRGSGRVSVLDGISFSLAAGDTLGLVGESGSGKTVTGLAIMGLLPRRRASVNGQIRFDGEDVVRAGPKALRALRGRRIGMVFQEPMVALDPVFTIGEQISETLRAHFPLSRRQARERSIQALHDVGISLPSRRIDEYPHHLSGGMRQRVMIAMSLVCEPSLLIADEPTTALDVTTQAQIVRLLLDIVSRRRTALIFISHNLGVVAEVTSRVLTMYAGQVVEDGSVDDVLERPLHPYTSALIRSQPRFAAPGTPLAAIAGTAPQAGAMPTGCRFAPRCAHAVSECREEPDIAQVTPGHAARCLRVSKLSLPGAV